MSLTDDDKSWIKEILVEGFRAERAWLKDELAVDRAWMTEELTANRAWLTEELALTRAWMTNQVVNLTAQIDILAEQIVETNARIERVETSLLTAFHQWASPLEIRIRAHSLAISAYDAERENTLERDRKIVELEKRISKLEKAS